MPSSKTLPKPMLAVVIAFCDSTPHDPIPRPYVIAQRARDSDGKYELWNMPITQDMSSLEVFQAFTDAYLHPSDPTLTASFMQLAVFETEHYKLRIFAASRLFRWQNFRRLDDKELVAFTSARKQPIWTETTQTAVESAYRSKGMKLILDHAKMVRRSQHASLQAHA